LLSPGISKLSLFKQCMCYVGLKPSCHLNSAQEVFTIHWNLKVHVLVFLTNMWTLKIDYIVKHACIKNASGNGSLIWSILLTISYYYFFNFAEEGSGGYQIESSDQNSVVDETNHQRSEINFFYRISNHLYGKSEDSVTM